MSYNSETGRVYIDETTTPKTGIGIADISKAVGYSSGDLGTLIDKGIINAYSAVKPVRSAAHQIDDYSTVDISYGFNSNEIIAPSLDNAFDNCRQYKYWEKLYLRPRGVQNTDTTIEQYVERYRFLDFNGYWKYAPHPYKYNNIEDIVFYGTKNNFKNTPQSFGFSINSEAEIFITSFKALLENGDESTLSEWKYGMLVSDWSGTLTCFLGDSLTDISTNDPTADDVTKSFSVTFNDTGTFSLCFIATKYTGGDDIAVKTAWLDGGFHTVNISQVRIPIYVTLPTPYINVARSSDKTRIRISIAEYEGGSAILRDITLTDKRTELADNYNGVAVVSTMGSIAYTASLYSGDDLVKMVDLFMDERNALSYSGYGKKEGVVIDMDPGIWDITAEEGKTFANVDKVEIKVAMNTYSTDDNNGVFIVDGLIPTYTITHFDNL